MAQKNILIICGEPSGELHASNLAKSILEINHNIKISGVGGALLRNAGVEVFYDIKGLAVLGLFDVLKKLPKFIALKKLILQKIKEDKPDAIIMVDFSGFNLRLAKEINKSIPIIYYISPQVWASRPGRIKTIKEYISKIIVIFKFEEEFYKKYGIEVDFVGHPLLDIVESSRDRKEFLDRLKLYESKTTILLLPGSRKQEIENILPIMLNASSIIYRNLQNTQFIVLKSPQVDWDTYHRITHTFKFHLKVIEDRIYDCLNIADFCLVCSGTATLETAIMQKPFVVIYKMGLMNYLLYRPQVKVPYIGMVNIVAGKIIIPEFIQYNARPQKIADYVVQALNNPQQLNTIKENLTLVRNSLGEKGASLRAAQIILNFLGTPFQPKQGHPVC